MISDSPTPTQSNRVASLTTPLGPDRLVFRSMNGFERLSQPYEYRITALAPERDLYDRDFDILLGRRCSLSVQTDGGGRRYFHGNCAQISFAGHEVGGLLYELTLRPEFWFLSRNRNCRIYQNKTATDIVSNLLQERGISTFALKLRRGFPPERKYCVQYMESDFAFISRLLEHEGLHYFFRHDASSTTLIIADTNEAHDQIEGFADIPYFPPNAYNERERSHLDDWSPVHSVAAPVSTKATDFFYQHPQPMSGYEHVEPAYSGDTADMQIHPAGFEDPGYGQRLARYRLEAERALRSYATSSGNALGLQPGCTFTLRNHPRDSQNRRHLVVEARLHLEADAYTAGFGASGGVPERVDLVTIPAETIFRQPLSTPRPRIPGTQTAIVVGRHGEEIETEEVGAVKVSFHWDTYSRRDQTSSCWVRVGQSWAGGSWGSLFTPRVGMEVIVEFIDGDPDRPIIVGCVYNGRNAPPYGLPGDKTKSTIKSNSSKGGGGFNELRFEDKQGQEEIYIHAQKDQNVEILNNLSTTIGNAETRRVGASRTTTIGANDTKNVSANESTTIASNRSTSIGLNDTLTIAASRTMSVGISDTTTISASATRTVGGTETTSVGGALNMTVGGVMNLQVGGALNINAGGAINMMAPVVNVTGGLVIISGKSVLVG